jgi:flagellar hook-associated protein 3 FlgL
MATLTQELSTGRTSDVSTRLGGDYSHLADIDRSLARLAGFSLSAKEAATFGSAAQSRLEQLHDVSNSLARAIVSVIPSNLKSVRDHASMQASEALDRSISALNGTVAGRSIFGGIATDQAPLADSETLLTALKGAIAGASTADSIIQAADNWFDDPNGFRAQMYLGSDTDIAPIHVGPGQSVTMPLRADDEAFRHMLRNVALAALGADASLGFDADLQNDLLRKTGEQMFSDQSVLVALRTDLGFAEARIEEASTRNASAQAGLEMSRGALLEADPYETATRLEEVQFQLESLYSVTVRTSRLSLLNYLK